jgi:N-methylhydantoinase A/acetophenone carboxylase
MDVGHLYYRRADLPLDSQGDFTGVVRSIDAMEHEAARDMRGEGFSSEEIVSSLELFVQGADSGQEFKVVADIGSFESPDKINTMVQDIPKALFGGGQAKPEKLVLTMVGLMAQARIPHYAIQKTPRATGGVEQAAKGSRWVLLDEGKDAQEIPVYERSSLMHGHQLQGPALVESEHTTVLVQTGWRLSVDHYNNVVLEEVS